MSTVYRPPHSPTALAGVPFASAIDILSTIKADFDRFDDEIDHGSRQDEPSRCAAILYFPATAAPENGAVFWDAKLAIDADGGPNAGGLTGEDIDNDGGQKTTAFTFDTVPGDDSAQSLVAESNAYVVLPVWKDFGKAVGAETGYAIGLGDVAVVVCGDVVVPAIVGDKGPYGGPDGKDPQAKIGEASIKVHKALYDAKARQTDPCQARQPPVTGHCTKLRQESIKAQVLCFIFPHSCLPVMELTPQNIEAMVAARAWSLFRKLRGEIVPP